VSAAVFSSATLWCENVIKSYGCDDVEIVCV